MVLRLVVAVLHYMFQPTWPSSSVHDVSATTKRKTIHNKAARNITSKLIEQ
jgi:hypothetical protein